MTEAYQKNQVGGMDVCSTVDPGPALGLPGSPPFRDMAAILSRSPLGICITRARHMIWANPRFYEMTGYPCGSLAGKPTRILYPTDREYDRVGNRLVSGAKGRGTAVIDTRLSRKDGTAFDSRMRASLLDPDDPDRGLLIMVSDITDINSASTQARQTEKMEAIATLAGGISHDFNNLLMGIQGHLSLMRISLEDPGRLEGHIGQISRLVDTAADLTSRLLGFARGGKYQISVLDINQVVSMALEIFKPTRKDIRVAADFSPSSLSVDGDNSQLEQVFLNLLVNASQAMVDAGALFVATRRIHIPEDHGFHFQVTPGTYVEIEVRDTGIGMDPATRKKIFDPFFSTREIGSKKGRGLGLSTVLGIVKNHGGFITVESCKGKGSTFRVALPASDRPLPDSGDQGAVSLAQMPKGTETVLLVDDDRQVLKVGAGFLKTLGYTPMLAANGLEAVEIFTLYRDEISLVVLDLLMPVMDGKTAFSRIRDLVPEVKVLVSTGYHADQEVEDLISQGCSGFIQKPFSMGRFAREVREILDRQAR